MYAQLIERPNGSIFALGEDGLEYNIPLRGDLTEKVKNDIKYRKGNACYIIKPLPIVNKKREAKLGNVVQKSEVIQENLKEILDNWSQEALRDSPELFLRTEIVEEFESGKKIFLIGRKGTGKSAIAKNMVDSGKYVASFFSFENFPFRQFYQYETKEFSHSRYKPIWEVIYLTQAIELLFKDEKTPQAVREKIAARYKVNVDGSKVVESSKVAEIAYFFKKIINSAPVKIVGAAMSVDPIINVLDNVLDKIKGDNKKTGDVIDRGLESALVEIKEFIYSLGEFPKVLIVFDQLDEEYTEKGTANADAYSDILRSLFSASVDIVDMKLGIQPLVLLREDIYDSFQSANKGKFLDFMVTLNWTIDGMKEVISQRLNRTFGKPKEFPFENMWLSLFTPFFNESASLPDGRFIEKVNISSYDAFMRHTSRTPRDCIMLLLCVAKQMVIKKKQLCDINIFKAARIAMAEYFCQQVVDALSTSHPYITDVFRVMSENMTESKVSRQKLDGWLIKNLPNIHVDTDSLLNSLYDVCAIGLLNDHAKKYRTKYIGYPKYTLKVGDQIIVHPSIAISLGINISIQGSSLISEYKEEDIDDKEVIEAARQQIMIEQDRFSHARINNAKQEMICAEQLSGKLWSMLCSDIDDGCARLRHKRFDQSIKLSYEEHGITTPLCINDVCIVEIGIGINAKNQKKDFVVKSYAMAE